MLKISGLHNNKPAAKLVFYRVFVDNGKRRSHPYSSAVCGFSFFLKRWTFDTSFFSRRSMFFWWVTRSRAGVSKENKTSVGEDVGNKIISEIGKLNPARIELSET